MTHRDAHWRTRASSMMRRIGTRLSDAPAGSIPPAEFAAVADALPTRPREQREGETESLLAFLDAGLRAAPQTASGPASGDGAGSAAGYAFYR
jgi:hypothetical protein